ncbi:MAG: hypothetical protein MJB57_15545 [Gemmatimonadetes bacterium]|nr:hypothetical protein [Gemmatimonadota bacterium]
MLRLRKAGAALGLLALAGLIVTVDLKTPSGRWDSFGVSTWLLLLPLGFALCGALRERAWGRWLGLGAALAVLPWALILTIVPLGLPVLPSAIALAAAVLIMVSLLPRGSSPGAPWERSAGDPKERALVGATIVCGIAALPILFLFVGQGVGRPHASGVLPAGLLIILAVGVTLLARGKTLGVLVMAIGALALVPAGVAFFTGRSVHPGEAMLLAPTFLPAIALGLGCALVFARPMWRFLRDPI